MQALTVGVLVVYAAFFVIFVRGGLIVQRTAHSFRTHVGAACMMRPAVSLQASHMTVVEESVISKVLVLGGFVDGSGW